MRTAGVGFGGRRSGEPVVARAHGTLPLSGMPGAVRRELALLGTESRSGTRLSALDIASLEDANPRRLDWVERRAAETQPAMDRQQRTVSDPTMGAGQRAGQQDSGAERTANAAGLASPLWLQSAAAGNPGGRQPLSRNLLPSRQLDLSGTDRRARSHGPRTQSSRASYQRHLRISTCPRRPATSMQRFEPVNKYLWSLLATTSTSFVKRYDKKH